MDVLEILIVVLLGGEEGGVWEVGFLLKIRGGKSPGRGGGGGLGGCLQGILGWGA